MMLYQIIRLFDDGTRKIKHVNLTLEVAQAHCNLRGTSSRTAVNASEPYKGAWFDRYQAMPEYAGWPSQSIVLRRPGLLERALEEHSRNRGSI